MNPEKINENETPHLVTPDNAWPYWRMFLHCSDGRVVSGIGHSSDDAKINAEQEKEKREKYLSLQNLEKLNILCQGNLLSTDSKEAIQLINKILQDDYIRNNPRVPWG